MDNFINASHKALKKRKENKIHTLKINIQEIDKILEERKNEREEEKKEVNPTIPKRIKRMIKDEDKENEVPLDSSSARDSLSSAPLKRKKLIAPLCEELPPNSISVPIKRSPSIEWEPAGLSQPTSGKRTKTIETDSHIESVEPTLAEYLSEWVESDPVKQ